MNLGTLRTFFSSCVTRVWIFNIGFGSAFLSSTTFYSLCDLPSILSTASFLPLHCHASSPIDYPGIDRNRKQIDCRFFSDRCLIQSIGSGESVFPINLRTTPICWKQLSTLKSTSTFLHASIFLVLSFFILLFIFFDLQAHIHLTTTGICIYLVCDPKHNVTHKFLSFWFRG